MAAHARKTVGFLINDTAGSTGYENDLWTGAHDAAIARDIDLVVVAGSDFSEKARTGKSDPRNAIYGLCRPEEFDGIVITTTTTCMGLDVESAKRFIERFSDRPFVMISGFPGKYRSLIDNKAGVYATIDHLAKEHGRKRIGYIRGPEGTEADERFEAYKRALADNGLPYDERLVYVGKFLQSSGAACAKEFIEDRKVSFDAIGAANDSMAIGMIRGLRERGIRVPADVSVVGFDDIEGAAFHNPPLTTVKQPTYRQSYRAVEMVCDLIEGKRVERDQSLETEVVYRQSCGCAAHSAAIPVGAASDREENPKACIAKAMAASGIKTEDSSRAEKLAAGIAGIIRGSAESAAVESLCSFFDEILSSVAGDGASAQAWRKYARELIARLASAAGPSSGAAGAENLTLRFELISSQAMLRAEGARRLATARNTVAIRWLSQTIGKTYDIDEIASILDSELPKVGICGYSLAVFDPDDPVGLKDAAEGPRLRQIRASVDGKASLPDPGNAFFPAARLYARGPFTGKRRSIVVYPLAFGSECTGTIAMEIAAREGGVFDDLARQLSTSMMGARILAESRLNAKRIAERSDRIERLVLPMIGSLERVSRLAAEKSRDVQAIASMAKQSYERLDGTIGTIGKASKSISGMAELIGAIDDISTTVNLVSLNASIEASHAGQYGRGFAVIAKEIKKLAESTQVKSAEISASIDEIMANMKDTTYAGQECLESYREEELGVRLLIEIFEAITRDMGSLASDGRKILDTMQA